MVSFTVNGTPQRFDGDAEMPLLWYLREVARLKGTKFGCGIGQCGACTVHLDGTAARSCVTPIGAIDGVAVTTIEGLADGAHLHPVQQAWLEFDVPQCGYCQAGQMMAAADLLARKPQPTDADINNDITNICRCGTYYRIRKAIHRAATIVADDEEA